MNDECEVIEWAFPERNCDPPVGDINGKFQGVRLKVAGIPGRYAKIGGKNFFSWRKGESMQRMENFREVKIKSTGNPGGQLHLIWGGGGYHFLLEKPNV